MAQGSITDLGPGPGQPRGHSRWRLRVGGGWDPDQGRYRVHSRTVRGSRRDAERALSRLVADLDEDRLARSGVPTFAVLVDRWLAGAAERGELEATTLRTYRGLLDRWILPRIGGTRVDRITVEDLEGVASAMIRAGRAPATIRQAHAVTRRALGEAVRWGHVRSSPAGAVRLPRADSHEIAVPDLATVVRVLAAAAERGPLLGAAVRLALATGMRRGELCGLQWGDVDLEHGVVTVRRSVATVDGRRIVKGTKTRQEREVPVDPETVAVVRSWRDAQAAAAVELGVELGPGAWALTPDPEGREPWRPGALSEQWRRLADREAPGVRLHDLRHTMASMLLAHGRPLPEVSRRLGHSNVTTTANVYAHSLRELERQSADTMGRLMRSAGEPGEERVDDR